MRVVAGKLSGSERHVVDVDALLGKHVVTGDGREWVVSSVAAPRMDAMVRLLWRDTHIDLPLFLFLGALDYGLLEEV